MDMKLIVGVMLSVICGSTFAAQFENPRILSHKEWTTNNSLLKVQDAVADKLHAGLSVKGLTPHILNNDREYAGGVMYEDILPEVFANVGEMGNVVGYTSVYIDNYTQVSKKYTLYSLICVASMSSGMRTCGQTEDVVELMPNTYTNFSKSLSLPYQFTSADFQYVEMYSYAYDEDTKQIAGTRALNHVTLSDDTSTDTTSSDAVIDPVPSKAKAK